MAALPPVPPPSANVPFVRTGQEDGFLSVAGLDFLQKLWAQVGEANVGFTIPNLVNDYGGTADGVTPNDAAFQAAQSGGYSEIWIPDGLFETGLASSALNKHYVGRGAILFNASTTLTAPTPSGGTVINVASTTSALVNAPIRIGSAYSGTISAVGVGTITVTPVLPGTPIASGTAVSYVILAGPPNYGYLAAFPSTWPVQGVTGWFRGDQTFTDGGEYRVVGTGTRDFNLTQRYFESPCIPHHAWFDANSGNSGTQAFLTAGATAGATVIALPAAADASWVGKTVAFATSVAGAIAETHVIDAVNTAGNNITLHTPLANSYTWNPATGLTPNIFFSYRTWNGFRYIKVSVSGAGDSYGHIVRQNMSYVGKPTELHNFMRGTAGQYGGDMAFGAEILYGTGWESQYADQGHNVAVVAQVDSFIRTVDTYIPTSGNTWIGTKFQSGGTRPVDAGHVLTGPWRVGLDTTFANMMDTAVLTANTVGGGSTITVDSVNGAIVGDPVVIGDLPNYTGTITAVNSPTNLSVSPNLPGGVIASGTIVKYTAGGSVLNMAFGQRIVFNSTLINTARSGDSNAVFATNYGNVRGDIIMGTATDGSTDWWEVKFNGTGHGGATARLRLTPTTVVANVLIQSGGSIEAAKQLVTNGGYTATGANYGLVVFKSGSGNFQIFNEATARYEFYIANALAGHIP